MAIKTIKDIDVKGKRVLVRVDFNVPLSGMQITDDTRIVAALPTLKYLVSEGARVIIMSHLGRPKGEPNLEFSLGPIANALSVKLGQPVAFAGDCVGSSAEGAANSLGDGHVLLLENVRFHKGETDNDPEFAKQLASLGDIYVNDAFGTAHRAHASTEGVTKYLDTCVCGFLIEKELTFLGEKTSNPDRPFVVILGGAKVSDKIMVIDALLEKADQILIGGAMAYTFKLAQGGKVGDSLAEPDKVETARLALEKAKAKGVEFLLPEDNLVCNALDFKAGTLGETKIQEGDIEDGWEGVDIGPKTIATYRKAVENAKTVLWNGPMGIFEIEESSKGTFAVAEAVAEGNALSIIGGGDSVKAIKQSGYSEKVSFMSTGGGASLEFLEGKALPGVVALDQA
ncbi:phosphoglycerate kinase [Puniceicoccales bacterium CK1056]|uniref:Phosphoglycerate kinase n=1 Tax=Oceanipulchritudo coccoides TaxID=2706888 RepID=A0A6B2M3D7_9BACT|nr:phosphoglycerate kinase [Oceanipulchritudo coccoides]NDV62614.1 phosphoglycerate kinase [Oceanipulchritudo coccoides]